MNDKQVSVVWIEGQPYSRKHPKAKAARGLPVAGLGSAKPKPKDPSPALVKDLSGPAQGPQSPGSFHILIVRYGRKRLGSDVLPFAYKSIRDEIAMKLLGGTIGQFDDDPIFTWTYEQVVSKTTGTHILITLA